MKLTVASSPHIRGNFRTNRIMADVMIALTPALAVGVARFGTKALILTLVSMASAVAAEWLYSKLTKTRNTTVDGSALVTGMLLAMTLPHTCPLWLVILGSVFAIGFVKCLSGGLGQNIFNPALAARAAMMALYPVGLTRYLDIDGVTAATPLHHMVMPGLPEQTVAQMFLGNCPGSIGEISALALLAGGAYLVYRKVISVRIPAAYIGTVALLTLVFHKTDAPMEWMLYSLFSGGLMLGAIFMATDYATSPATPMGQIVYGIGCGVLTVFFRYFGLFPEGVTYAILLMNAFVWFIDRLTPIRRFGTVKGGDAK
ncbi:MAG: Na+-transporting NADH:ubiquinone oxidoreductase subunit D [Ruminococcaceae bacterium]|nr:Na+-transporting NADH:ubiquinone oxidoreductase subunit D [Oscillospiraceae bacterium]